MAATIAAVGNAIITFTNGVLQRGLEEQKAEQTRILEMIKTGNADKAAENLKFLLQAGLISDPGRADKLERFLTTREAGSGPTLPTPAPVSFPRGIVGPDDAVDISSLPVGNVIGRAAHAVGQLRMEGPHVGLTSCTAFLVADDLALTAEHCIEGAAVAQLVMVDGTNEISYKVTFPPVDMRSNLEGPSYALLYVEGQPGSRHGSLQLALNPPSLGEQLALVMFRSGRRQLAVVGVADCRIRKVENNEFIHGCDTGVGSSGAPILNVAGNLVLGIHLWRNELEGVAARVDAVVRASSRLRKSK